MLNVINATIRSLYAIDFVAFIIAIVFLSAMDRKKGLSLVLVFLFSVAWRTKSPIIASRYCIFFIILFLISISLFLKKLQQTKRYVVFKSFGTAFTIYIFSVIFINFIQVFSGSRNNFIFDLQNDISTFLSHDNRYTVLIERKEFERLRVDGWYDKQLILDSFPKKREDLDELYYQYNFWDDNALYIFSENKKNSLSNNSKKKQCIYNHETTFQKIRTYNTSPQRTISVYMHDSFFPETYKELFEYPELNRIVKTGILKSCSPFYDTYIYQLRDKLYWVIGTDLKKKDEIMFHLYSTRQEYLPERRIKHGDDNRGFYIGTEYEIGHYGRYRLFEQILPKEYPISRIVVGFMINREKIFFKSFTLSKKDLEGYTRSGVIP